jgi:hypothetical protein
MKMPLTPRVRKSGPASAYMLTEALVYISLLFVVLGVGYIALDRCIDNSVSLHRSADDIATALHAGERWRADVRAAGKLVRLENSSSGQVLNLEGAKGMVAWRFSDGAVFRRIGAGSWARLLDHVSSSVMESDPRQNVVAWRWELELQPRLKGSVKPGRVRPLFTFISVREGGSAQ